MTMSARFDYAKNTKTINEEDTLTVLSDQIADTMLLYGGDPEKVAQAISDAHSSALTHYEAERGGESDGTPILVERADGTEGPLEPGEPWTGGPVSGPSDEAQDEGETASTEGA